MATLDELRGKVSFSSPNLRSILDRIQPSVEELLSAPDEIDESELVRQAVRANIRAATEQLRHGSAVIEELVRDDGLKIVGAKYSLQSGVVDFLDD